MLSVLRRRWPQNFQASEVSAYAGQAEDTAIAFRSALEHAAGKALRIISATTVAWRLKALADAPVQIGNEVLVLKYKPDHEGGSFSVVRMHP